MRGVLPFYHGDVMIMCGSFQENFVHKALRNPDITRTVIDSFPAVNTSIRPSVERLLHDMQCWGEGDITVTALLLRAAPCRDSGKSGNSSSCDR